jgi:hypothetical protein
MKKIILHFILCAFLSIWLSGCLDTEGIRLGIDMDKGEAEVVYLNIVSRAQDEAGRKGDLRDLLAMAYGEKGNTVEASVTSSSLYPEGGLLNGRQTVLINDREAFLSNYDIKQDYRGYIMTLTDDNVTYVGGNGVYIESSAGRQVIWDRDTSVLRAELRYDLGEGAVSGMLPYWEEWRKWDSIKGPDAAGLLKDALGDAVKPQPDENVIDYCPEGVCYSFSTELHTDGSFGKLADFTYLYLYHIADYASVEGFKTSDQKYAPEIAARNMLTCPSVDEEEDARCALRNLADTYSIRLTSITYGEEDSREEPIDLEGQLK